MSELNAGAAGSRTGLASECGFGENRTGEIPVRRQAKERCPGQPRGLAATFRAWGARGPLGTFRVVVAWVMVAGPGCFAATHPTRGAVGLKHQGKPLQEWRK